jgi:hypothetical protein
VPKSFNRDYEDGLLDLCASGNTDPNAWRSHGSGFFMGGLAVVLASARDFEREGYLRLAETLHPGVSSPEVFAMWLKQSPLRPARFLPMARRRKHPPRAKPKATATAQAEYLRAFAEVLSRVQQTLKGSQPDVFPIRMYIAGGAALHFYTGARVTEDVDVVFSKRVLFKEDIEVSYRDPDGCARLLYLDRRSNDTLGLLHEDAYENSQPVEIPGVDKKVIEVRMLSPVDLAVTKLARFADQDREDIELLAKRGLIDAVSLRKRAEEALGGYVGEVSSVRTSIDIACRLIDSMRPPRKR